MKVGLPTKPFLYTLDQVAGLISVTEKTLKLQHVFFMGKDTGVPPTDRMKALNIRNDTDPDWRISEKEFVRWLNHQGFHLYERDWDE